MQTEVDVPRSAEVADSTHKRRVDIEALRALAVGGVIAFHFNFDLFGGGYAGVDVFFVISGFLITSRLLEESALPIKQRLIGFYARRVRRILPAASFVLIASALLATFIQRPFDAISVTAPDVRSASLFIVNRAFVVRNHGYLLEAEAPSLIEQYWSLSVEEQFYAIWPLLLTVCVGLGVALFGDRLRRHLTILICSGVIVLSFLLCLKDVDSRPIPSFFSLQYRAWELGIGALLATSPVLLARIPRRIALAATPAGLIAILATFTLVSRETSWPGIATIVPVLATALVIATGNTAGARPLDKLLGHPVIQLIGRWSFSLYLWHWPVLLLFTKDETSALTLSAALAVTIVAAGLTFRWVEQPARNWRWLQERQGLTLAFGAGLTALVVAASYLPTAIIGDLHSGKTATRVTRSLGDAPTPTPYVPSNLEPSLLNGRSINDPNAAIRTLCLTVTDCVLGDTESDFNVVLFGDSYAGHWSAALAAVGRERGWRVTVLTRGCPSTFFKKSVPGKPVCAPWAQAMWKAIQKDKPEVLILSNRWLEQIKVIGPKFAQNVEDAIALANSSTRVIVVSQTPLATDNALSCLAEHLNDALACGSQLTTHDVPSINDDLRSASSNAGAYFADLTPLMCIDGFCPAIDGTTLVYREGAHVTSSFARTLAADFGDHIDAALTGLSR